MCVCVWVVSVYMCMQYVCLCMHATSRYSVLMLSFACILKDLKNKLEIHKKISDVKTKEFEYLKGSQCKNKHVTLFYICVK